MAKFTYNNAKNVKNSHMSFELKFDYHSKVSFKEHIHPCFKFKLINKLLARLQKLITFVVKTSTMRLSFKKMLIIKLLSLEAMH